MTTFVPPWRAGIRGDARIPLVLPGFEAGTQPTAGTPEPMVRPSWMAGLRAPWFPRLVGRGR